MRHIERIRRRAQGGMIMLLFVLSLIALIPMVGLAVDAVMLYVVRTRLQSAVDAAALAAGRALNVNQPLSQQITYAQGRATAFFNANFPSGYLMSTNSSVVVDPPFYGTGVNARTLYTTVHGQADSPLFFMRYLMNNASTVRVIAQSARRDVNIVMVLDKSGSMSSVCGTMKQAAQNFVNYFSPGRDTLGLISFNGAYNIDFAPSPSFMNGNPNLQTAIGNISCGGNTGTAQALYQGYQRILAINQPAALNVIVFFTDGQPNGVVANYPIKRSADSRYGDGVSDRPSGCSANNISTLCNYPASTCSAGPSTITGYMAEWNNGPAIPGVTAGVMNYIGNENPISTVANCKYNSYGATAARRDVAYIPASDIYGNATVGYKTDWILQSDTYQTNRDRFTSGVYSMQLRPDSAAAISNASYNAADAQGDVIRGDTTFDILIFAIGLGGNPGYPPDTDFMVRLTNVPSATDPYSHQVVTNSRPYDSARPTGKFIYVTDPNQLNTAFAELASSILRLSQ